MLNANAILAIANAKIIKLYAYIFNLAISYNITINIIYIFINIVFNIFLII